MPLNGALVAVTDQIEVLVLSVAPAAKPPHFFFYIMNTSVLTCHW